MSDSSSGVTVARFEGERALACEDVVAREEPLEIQLGGTSLAVVMRTPGHDEELALGFLVTERVVAGRDLAGLCARAGVGAGGGGTTASGGSERELRR